MRDLGMIFNDRYDAGIQLAEALQIYKNNKNVVVVAIPRGGLQIGAAIVKELSLPLDVVLIKKIGHPHNPEFAIGAVGLESYVVEPEFLTSPTIVDYLEKEIVRLRALLKLRSEQYHRSKSPIALQDKIVILCDDGVATGHTMIASIKVIRSQNPEKIIVAIPVAVPDALLQIEELADEVICLQRPVSFSGVSQYYRHFAQVDDEQAISELEGAL